MAGQLSWFGCWAIVTAIGAILSPDKSGHGTHQQLGLPPCPSVMLFDRPCPGCGMTTSWTAFIHGHFAEAFHAHPLGPPMYILFTVSALLSVIGYAKGARFGTDTKEFNRITMVAVVIFLSFGFLRMALTPHFGTPTERWLTGFSRQ